MNRALYPYFEITRFIREKFFLLAKAASSLPISLFYMLSESNSTLRGFRYLVKSIAEQDTEHAHIPDYTIRLDSKNTVVVTNRKFLKPQDRSIVLDAETYHDARTVAQGWDVYYLEHEWRNWMADGGLDAPQSPDRAFLGFVQRWVEKRGQP